jgi:hypothetical protein
MNQQMIDDLKDCSWQKIIDYGNSLSDLNEAQLRFAKGLAIEAAVEKLSNSDLTYVGEKHRDYHWPTHNVDVELKSIFSQRMYDRKGNLKNLPGIRLNNSMGSNKDLLDPKTIADIVVVVCADGAFAVDKATVLATAKHHGDGWELRLKHDQITELSGPITQQNKYNLKLADKVRDAIKESISGL